MRSLIGVRTSYTQLKRKWYAHACVRLSGFTSVVHKWCTSDSRMHAFACRGSRWLYTTYTPIYTQACVRLLGNASAILCILHILCAHACVIVHQSTPTIHACMRSCTQTYIYYTRMHASRYTKVHLLYTHACVAIHKYTPIIHACMRRYTQHTHVIHACMRGYTRKYMHYTRMHALVYTNIHLLYTHACVDIHKYTPMIHACMRRYTQNTCIIHACMRWYTRKYTQYTRMHA